MREQECQTVAVHCQTEDVDYEYLLQKAISKAEKYAFANDLMYQQVCLPLDIPK